jgi:triosephosphate isomerase
VNTENAAELFSKENIAGGLIGQASLDPESFLQIIQNS